MYKNQQANIRKAQKMTALELIKGRATEKQTYVPMAKTQTKLEVKKGLACLQKSS